ncbi:MAG: DUF4253 domain-containing protein, partial [Gorillibacterium sp.]|nr:DUF4253 domain-containing protein [Gorillibacterium sp.]
IIQGIWNSFVNRYKETGANNMWLLLGIAVALVYIIFTNKKKQQKRKKKHQKPEKAEGRQPIAPYRWSAESTEEQERESSMALLSAEKLQNAIPAPATAKTKLADTAVVTASTSSAATGSEDEGLRHEEAVQEAKDAADAGEGTGEAEAVAPSSHSEASEIFAEAGRTDEAVPASTEGAASGALIRSFWEAGRELLRLSGKEPQSFSTLAGGTRRYPYCQSALTDKRTARAWVDELQARLSEDLVAFIGTTHWENDAASLDAEVVIGKSESSFDILRLAQTDAAQYDLSTEDLIAKLRDLDLRYGIRIYAAESDSIGFELQSVPEDLPALAAELHVFCPSAEIVGHPEQLAAHLQVTRDIELRWV